MSSWDHAQRRSRIFQLKAQGKLDEALAEIEALEQEGAQGGALAVDKADVLARRGQRERALQLLEEARDRYRLSLYGQALLAGLLESQDRGQEARSLFESLAHEPKLPASVLKRVNRHFLDRGEPERARALAERQENETPTLCCELAASLEEAGRWEEAVAELERGHARWPEDGALLSRLVRAQLRDEPPEAHVEELEVLLSMPDHSAKRELKRDLALKLRKIKRDAQAVDLFLELLEHSPNDGFLLAQLGHAYRSLGRYESAADVLERALSLKPTDTVAQGAFFRACRDAGLRQRAAAYIRALQAKHKWAGALWKQYRKAFEGET